METQEKEFTGQESLQIIQGMIMTAKKQINDSSFYFLLWGWMCVIGNLMGYFCHVNMKYDYEGYSWAMLSIIGGIIHGIYASKREKRARVKTYVDDCMKYLWGAFIIVYLLIMIFLLSYHQHILISPVLFTLVGLATFTTGGVIQFKPLIIGGIVFWVFAVITFLIPTELQYMLSAMAMICGYIIPGYMLKSKYKKENV